MMKPSQKHTGRSSSAAIPDAFSTGGRIETGNLVALQKLSRQLPLRKQRKVLSTLAGTHISRIRGRGTDFSEVRQYQPGDDIRTMDWRVTARTGSAHIKVFQEEKERPVLLVCDLRSSMRFGTRRALKRVLAADICALLGWAALNEGDRIGALIFDDQKEIDLRPSTGAKQVLNLIQSLAAEHDSGHESAEQTSSPLRNPQQRFEAICQHLRRIARPGSSVYFISDWHGWSQDAFRQLYQVTRHCDLTAIQVYDRMESELPPPGVYDVTDGNQRARLNTHSTTLRSAHRRAFEQFCQQLVTDTRRIGTPLISIATDQNPLQSLRDGFGITRSKRTSP